MTMTNADVDASLAKLETAINTWSIDTASLISAMVAAFNNLLQKIATGAPDLTPEVTRINTLLQTVTTADQTVVSAIATAKVEQAS